MLYAINKCHNATPLRWHLFLLARYTKLPLWHIFLLTISFLLRGTVIHGAYQELVVRRNQDHCPSFVTYTLFNSTKGYLFLLTLCYDYTIQGVILCFETVRVVFLGVRTFVTTVWLSFISSLLNLFFASNHVFWSILTEACLSNGKIQPLFWSMI